MVSDEIILKHLVEGKSCPQIAKLYGINTQKIQRRLRKLTLPDDVYIKHKPSSKSFTQTELDVLVGGLLGDSWIGYSKNSKNPSGSFTHKLEHEDYVKYKYSFLKRLCSKPTIHNKFDKRSNRRYQQAFCKIATNPLLKEIVDCFYIEGIKIVCKKFLERLSPLAVAIWFMDDGSKSTNGYKISTDCFSRENVVILVDWLHSFGIKSTINSENAICINSNSRSDFTNLVSPFFIPCMRYKLHEY